MESPNGSTDAFYIKIDKHYGSSDHVTYMQHGIPAVMFGAGDPRLWHTDDEVVAVPDVVTCARVLAHATFRHLASEAGLSQDRPS